MNSVKHLGFKKIWLFNKFSGQEMLDQKKILCQKMLWLKKFLGQKFFWGSKICSTRIRKGGGWH